MLNKLIVSHFWVLQIQGVLRMSRFCEDELKDTNIVGLTILLVIVRYIHGKGAQEDKLTCRSLSTRATAVESINLIDSYFEKQDISRDLCHQV